MLQKPNLKHLVSRIKLGEKFLIAHPESEKLIRNNIDRQKEYIIQCVMENENNPLLKEIRVK